MTTEAPISGPTSAAETPAAPPRQWARWLIPLLAVLGLIPLQMPVHIAGVYLIQWQGDFGWSRGNLGLALSIYTIVIVLVSPVVGWLVDRFGVRGPICASMLMMAVAYAGFSMLQQPVWQLYAAFAALGVLGAGGTAVSFNRAIVQRFDAHLGIALAIAQSATAVSVLASPFLAYRLLEAVSWRHSWLVLALLPLVLAPVLFIGLRAPTPTAQTRLTASADAIRNDRGVDYGVAMRSPRLWLFAFSFGLFFFANAGVMGQFVPIMKDIGIPVGQAVTYQMILGISVLVGRLGTGHVLDRVTAKFVYAGVGALGAAGFLALSAGAGPWVIPGIVGVGIALGAEIDVASYMTSKYFGPKNYGKIFGVIYSSLIAGGIFSHPFYGFVADATGGYRLALLIGAAFMMVGALLLIRTPPYPKFEA